MNLEQCAELSRRLEGMDRGDAPGSEPLVPVWARSEPYPMAAMVTGSPSVAEMEAALQSNVELMNSADCLRALVMQNNVLIRDAIWRRQHIAVGSSSGQSGSLCSSLTTTGSASGHSSGDSGGVSPIRKKKVSPPKVFECPVCHDRLNEKDFDRHIFAWTAKVDKTGVVRCDSCAGIRDVNHPLLQRYPHGTLAQRVSCVVTCIRSLLHPGAYDAMSAEGSGRHILVAERVAWLLGN